MGSLLLFKEVFLGHRNRRLLQTERDPSPVQSRGETFIVFSWAGISFQMVLVFFPGCDFPFLGCAPLPASAQQGKQAVAILEVCTQI